MLASVTMCNDDIRNYNSKISDLGYLTVVCKRFWLKKTVQLLAKF